MTGNDDGFDTRLAAMFAESAPPADASFTSGVMQALPPALPVRQALLALSGLLGLLVAGSQLPGLIAMLDAMTGGMGAMAAGLIGPQALAMGIVAVILTGVTHVLFRRSGLDL